MTHSEKAEAALNRDTLAWLQLLEECKQGLVQQQTEQTALHHLQREVENTKKQIQVAAIEAPHWTVQRTRHCPGALRLHEQAQATLPWVEDRKGISLWKRVSRDPALFAWPSFPLRQI